MFCFFWHGWISWANSLSGQKVMPVAWLEICLQKKNVVFSWVISAPTHPHTHACLVFYAFQISCDTTRTRKNSAINLRHLLATNPSAVKSEVQYVACLPETDEHENHPVVGEGLVDNWSRHNDCLIKFRTSHDNDDGSSTKLLFCLQTTWQQRLMHLYGEQMCLLDATYRTCRYSIPLFFYLCQDQCSLCCGGCFCHPKWDLHWHQRSPFHLQGVEP